MFFPGLEERFELLIFWLKVDNAVTAKDFNSYDWFKVAEEGFNTTSETWAVDRLLAGDASGVGWWSFIMPSCLAPGQYLMRIE